MKSGAVGNIAITIAACGGILFGLGFYTFYYAQGASYLSDNPIVCTNCHIMRDEFDSWQKGTHHTVAVCNDCHLPHEFPAKYLVKMENGFNHSRKFTFQNFHEPIKARESSAQVVQDNCLRCHRSLVGGSAGAYTHTADEQKCVRCHREVGHGAPH